MEILPFHNKGMKSSFDFAIFCTIILLFLEHLYHKKKHCKLTLNPSNLQMMDNLVSLLIFFDNILYEMKTKCSARQEDIFK